MPVILKLAIAVCLATSVTAPVYALDTTKTVKTGKLKSVGTGGTGGTVTTGTGGTGVAELSAWDCKNVGGTVVTVTDDRCGASRQYCRMPDTNAVCIDSVK
jgi:putative hemolysin